MEFNGPQSIKIKKNPKAGYFGVTAYPRSVTTLSCQISKGGFNTGLTEAEERFYEKELDLKVNELNKHSKWWGETFNVEYPIKLSNTKTTELLLDNPINQLKYKSLLVHTDVANNELERNRPNILFYIDDQETKAKEELKMLNFELEGMKLILKLTPEETKNSLRLFGKAGLELVSSDMAQAQLMQEMKKDPKKFFDIITDKDLITKLFIYELLEKKILTRKGNYILSSDETIANSIDECVHFINDPINQSTRLAFETRLKKTKKVA